MNKSDPCFIFEFKYAGKDNEDLDVLASKALAQIVEKKYDSDLNAQGMNKIIKIGIAFRGKKAVVRQF